MSKNIGHAHMVFVRSVAYICMYRFNIHAYVCMCVWCVCVGCLVPIALCISCVTGRYSDEYEDVDLLEPGTYQCVCHLLS